MSLQYRGSLMLSSHSWKNNFYFIHDAPFIRKFFGIAQNKIEDYCHFLLCPINKTLDSRGFDAGYFKIIPFNRYDEVSDYLKDIDYLNKNTRVYISVRDRVLSFERKNIMAILNATPDSFFPGSRLDPSDIESKIEKIKDLKIDIVDIGGESTRPGSDPVGPVEEWRRIKPVLETALQKGLTVSVDTYRSKVAEQALEMGAHIINDVTGMEDERMAHLTKKYESGLILMHKKGNFKNMQDNPYYENVILEILDYFYERISLAREYDIEDKIILDPGIGFGKRIEDNLDIIRFIKEFKIGYPLLIGLSRKGFIGKIMNESVEERALSSVIFNSVALMNGADIIRVHDLEENLKLIKIINEINNF